MTTNVTFCFIEDFSPDLNSVLRKSCGPLQVCMLSQLGLHVEKCFLVVVSFNKNVNVYEHDIRCPGGYNWAVCTLHMFACL